MPIRLRAQMMLILIQIQIRQKRLIKINLKRKQLGTSTKNKIFYKFNMKSQFLAAIRIQMRILLHTAPTKIQITTTTTLVKLQMAYTNRALMPTQSRTESIHRITIKIKITQNHRQSRNPKNFAMSFKKFN